MTLRLIEGSGGGRGGGGGGGGGATPSTPPPFRKAPLADSLFKVLVRRNAPQRYTDMAVEVGRLEHRRVSLADIAYTMMHVRDNAYEYEWTVCHTKKGGNIERRYIVALVDRNNPGYRYWSDEHVQAIWDGAHSHAKTIATMSDNAAVAYEIQGDSNPHLTRGQRRKVRAMSAMFSATADMVRRVIAEVA